MSEIDALKAQLENLDIRVSLLEWDKQMMAEEYRHETAPIARMRLSNILLEQYDNDVTALPWPVGTTIKRIGPVLWADAQDFLIRFKASCQSRFKIHFKG